MSTAPAVVAVVKDAPLPPGSASVDGPASASLYQPLDPSGPLQFLLKVSMRRWWPPYSAMPSVLIVGYPEWPNGT